MAEVIAQRALTLDPNGQVIFEKDADTTQAPASTMKIVTAYVALQWIDLADTMTVTGADAGGTFFVGDILTYEAAMHAMLLPSYNVAATLIARNVGNIIAAELGGTGDVARFHQEMTDQMAALGWSGHVFADASGASESNRASIRQLCRLMRRIDATSPDLVTIMGALDYGVVITGPNARTIDVEHSIDPTGAVLLPEFVAGKTGTTAAAGAGVVVLWENEGQRYVSGLLNSTSGGRFPDLRALMDEAISAGPVSPARRGSSAVAFL